MDIANLAIAAVVATVLGVGLLSGIISNRKWSLETKKYPLYAARDNLLKKIVLGKLRRDNPDVEFLYQLSNAMINTIQPLSLDRMFSLFSLSDHKSEIAERLAKIASSENKDLADAAREIIRAAMVVLTSNSSTLRLGLGLARMRLLGFRIGVKCAEHLKLALSHISKTQERAVDLYLQLSRHTH